MIKISNLKKSLSTIDASITEILNSFESSALQIVLVVDNSTKLIGIITDGDIRRHLLDAGVLTYSTSKTLMNSDFISVPEGTDICQIESLMKTYQIHHIPVLDENGVLVGLHHIDHIENSVSYSNLVVIMAGGLGQRLHPYTLDVPKPMLPINGQPMLENLIFRLSAQGFNNIFISVNYRGEQIENYFGDGSEFGVSITYLRENSPMGTAGSLSLLPNIDKSILILNGDVVTNLDFSRVIRYHEKTSSLATVCLRNHEVQIPYAVARSSGKSILELTEKPTYSFPVNAGIYVLSHEALVRIPSARFDMTELLDDILNDGISVNGFPMHESWRDIGTPDDYKEVQSKS
jgi:dTDP-glucose pyrophosphorylase